MRYLSARHILSLAKVVEAVQEGRKVRWVRAGDGQMMEGTLRSFVDHDGGTNSATRPDIRDTHIRITTVHGFDTWLETEEVAGLYEEGAISL